MSYQLRNPEVQEDNIIFEKDENQNQGDDFFQEEGNDLSNQINQNQERVDTNKLTGRKTGRSNEINSEEENTDTKKKQELIFQKNQKEDKTKDNKKEKGLPQQHQELQEQKQKQHPNQQQVQTQNQSSTEFLFYPPIRNMSVEENEEIYSYINEVNEGKFNYYDRLEEGDHSDCDNGGNNTISLDERYVSDLANLCINNTINIEEDKEGKEPPDENNNDDLDYFRMNS